MSVTASPNVQQYDKVKNVIEDDPFQVECIAWGNQPLSVTWKFKGAAVVADGDRVTLKNSTGSGHLLENSTLRIQSVNYDDEGDYVCVAENEHGNASATITIHVKGTSSLSAEINFPEPFSKICANRLPVFIISFPPPHNTSVISRLRSSTPLPRPTSRTKKFESFVNFALNKYQSPL